MGWKLDKNKCMECGACVSVCPFSALELGRDGLEYYVDKCTLCGICERVCPVSAITVKKEEKHGKQKTKRKR
jgi:electron transfer flavoprotein alpha subunit